MSLEQKRAELERKRQELELKKQRIALARQMKQNTEEAVVPVSNETPRLRQIKTPRAAATLRSTETKIESTEDIDAFLRQQFGVDPEKFTPRVVEPILQPSLNLASVGGSTAPTQQSAAHTAKQPKWEKLKQLKITNEIATATILPKNTQCYSKNVQTIESSLAAQDEAEDKEDVLPSNAGLSDTGSNAWQDVDKDNNTLQDDENTSELDEETVREIEESQSYKEFINRASLFIERCLAAPYNSLQTIMMEKNSKDIEGVNLFGKFTDRVAKHRAVTSVSWSRKHPELFVASYYSRSDVVEYPEGVVLIWNLNLPTRPEHVFHCEEPISCATFYKYDENHIIGGTYSGQIAMWDIRAKETPEFKSVINTKSHTNPIFGLEIIGTKNSHNIVSLSTDGRLCVWTYVKGTITQTQVLDLVVLDESNTKIRKEIVAFALAFPENEANKYFVGGENGSLYLCTRFGSQNGIDKRYDGHFGPITGIDCHPSGDVDFSDLIISSSMDWSVKLWSQKSTKPIFSFDEFDDYVYDVKWSPRHPAVFATVDGTGKLKLWNLNRNTEEPVHTIQVSHRALNKLQWKADGCKIAVGAGGAGGTVFIYSLKDEQFTPQDEDWSKFEQVLVEMHK